MTTKKLSSALLLLFIILCSFGTQDKINLNIVFIGDSITHGARLKDFTTQAPPVFATGFLQKKPGFGNIQFSNQGVSGFTTVDFYPPPKKPGQRLLPRLIHLRMTDRPYWCLTLCWALMIAL